MSRKLQAPRGTLDVQPADARRRLRILRTADELLGRAGYEPFDTPVFEDTELFARGVGESTDIVGRGFPRVSGPVRAGPRAAALDEKQ